MMFYDIGYHGLGDNMGQFSGSLLATRKLQIMIFLGAHHFPELLFWENFQDPINK